MYFASTLGTMKQKMFCVGSNLLMCSSQLAADCSVQQYFASCVASFNHLKGTAPVQLAQCLVVPCRPCRALQGTEGREGYLVYTALQDTHCRALQEGIKAEGLLQMRGHRVWGKLEAAQIKENHRALHLKEN